MFQSFNQLKVSSNVERVKLFSGPFKFAGTLCFIFTLLLPISSVSAHKRSSWKPFLNFYESGECKVLIRQLKPLAKPKSWTNSGLWNRSRIMNAKCQLQLGNYNGALKSLKQTPKSEVKDAWIFQKIRILLKSNQHK